MKFILGAIVWLFILLLAIIPLGILLLIKLIVNAVYCRPRRNNNEENIVTNLVPLKSLDILNTCHNSWTKPIFNVGFALRVNGNIEIDQFRKHFTERFHIDSSESSLDKRYEKFYSYLVTRAGYVYRAVSPTLNIEQHILERKLETLENGEGEALEQFLSRWILESYTENKPAWEIVLVPIPNGTAVAFKIHHGLCDGYSMLHIIDTLTGTKSPYLVKPFTDGFCVQLKQLLEAPLNMGKINQSMTAVSPLKKAPETLDNPKYGWLFGFTEFPLESVKTLRRKNNNVHMVSIICTIMSGALRRFLLEELQRSVEDIPEYIIAGCTLPWPEHPAMIEGTANKDKICNHWSNAVLKLPLQESDPAKRSVEIEADYCDYISVGLDKFINRAMSPVFGIIPTSAINYSAATAETGLTATNTSLIGGDNYNLLGHSVSSIHPMKAINHNGPFAIFSVFTFSHSGKMEVTVSVNPGNIEISSQKILDKFCHKYFQDEFEHFMSVTENRDSK